MKKLILTVAVATMIAGVVFVACQKETTKTDKKEVIKQGVKQQKEMSHWGLNWKWDASVGECLDLYPRDCFDEVIIRPEQRNSYREFIQEVTLSSDAVANVFSDDNRFREIIPYLEGEILDRLRDGSLYMHHVVSEEINKEFLIATPESFYEPGVEVLAIFQFRVLREGETLAWGLNWKWDASVGECLDLYPRDCFDEVIIRPEQRNSYREFIQEVTLSSDAVANVFSDDNRFREIIPYLEGEILDRLRDGSLYMHHVVSEEINKEFLIATPESFYDLGIEDVIATFQFRVLE